VTSTLKSLAGFLSVAAFATPAAADWKAIDPDVVAATRDPQIAGALAAVNAIDHAAMSSDPAGFAAFLADDLAVNNPQNGVSIRGATAQRSAAGKISYSHYDRVIDYAGLRAGMVVLMGEEIVTPLGETNEVHRRFTDLWKSVDGHWRLTARQATIIARP
jgi:hypothetical protein